MPQLLLALALFSPAVDGGVRVGGGLLAEQVVLVGQPWLAFRTDSARLALIAPLNIDLEEGGLRERDWDEPGDYGRIVHALSWGDWLRGGVVSNRTMGNGTIVRRYHNGTDRDHARLGLDIHLDRIDSPTWAPNHVEILIDQVLAAPVIATALGRRSKSGHLLWTTAADFSAPHQIRGTVDERGWLHSQREVRWAYGLSGRWAPFDLGERWTLAGLLDLNSVGAASFGGHLGFGLAYDDRQLWRVEYRLTGMLLGEGYTWSLFDTGYLIDRWRGVDRELERADQTWGAQTSLQLSYADALILGVEFSDCAQDDRMDFGGWLRVPLERVTVQAYWRARRVSAFSDLFDPAQVMAALSARARLTQPFHAEFVLARDWFVDVGDGAYQPSTSVLFMFEASWGSAD